MVTGLVLVNLLIAAGGGGRLFPRTRIESQRAIKGIVPFLKLEERLVTLLLVLKVGTIKRLQEIKIEVTRRLRR